MLTFFRGIFLLIHSVLSSDMKCWAPVTDTQYLKSLKLNKIHAHSCNISIVRLEIKIYFGIYVTAACSWDPANNNSSFVLVIAWHRLSVKPLPNVNWLGLPTPLSAGRLQWVTLVNPDIKKRYKLERVSLYTEQCLVTAEWSFWRNYRAKRGLYYLQVSTRW